MHFRQILVKIFSQTSKLENAMSNEPIFLNPKTQTRKFLNFETRKNSNPNPKEATKLEPKEIQTQSNSKIQG